MIFYYRPVHITPAAADRGRVGVFNCFAHGIGCWLV
jgi:hypothetical protein